MTIKEVEARTGLTRANIRYYEDRGFFSAVRGENGYRDYSDENVDTLLKVKLLRQLGFSLEEIGELQRGERSLEPALERREEALGQQRRELDQAARLCRDMRSDKVSFYTLNARRYLDQLVQGGEIISKDQDPVRIFPWRRYFARELDLIIWTTLATVILQMTAHMNFIRTGTLLPMLLGLLTMTGAEVATLHFFGTTPGKALFGLKILREDGSKFSVEEAVQRTVPVMTFFGGGMLLAQIPVLLFALIGLGMNVWACWKVYHESPLFWEPCNQLYLDGSTRDRAFWEERRNYLRVVGGLAVAAACVGLTVGGHVLASMPPHRGPALTVEQFVENYNRSMEFSYGRENLSYRLTESGIFEEIPRDSGTVVVYMWGESPVDKESFRFVEKDGVLTQVTLVRAYDSGEPITEQQSYAVSIPWEEIAIAARSFLWKPLGQDGTAELYAQLLEREGSLSWEREGFTIDSTARFSGYSFLGDDTLFAQEGKRQSYFVECTMTRTK